MASIVFLETSGSSIPTPPMSANTLFVNPSGVWQSKDNNNVVTNIGQAGNVNGATNLGTGIPIFSDLNINNLEFNSISGAGSVSVSLVSNTVIVSGAQTILPNGIVISGSSTILNVLDATVLSGTSVNSDLINTKQLEVGPAQILGPTSAASIGVNNTVSGQFASAIGNSNTVLSTNGLALGNSNHIYSSANNSVALSYNNQIFGQNSLAFGNGSMASGANSIAAGGGITLHPQSMVFTDGTPWTSTAPDQLTLGFQGGVTLTSDTTLTTNQYITTLVSGSASAATSTYTVNWNNGSTQKIVFSGVGAGNCAITLSNGIAGSTYALETVNNSASGITVSWANSPRILWQNQVSGTMTSGASSVDLFCFLYDGNSYLGSTTNKYL